MTLFKVAFCIVLACLVQICQPFLFGSLNCRYGNWSKCSLDNNGHITRTRNPLKGSNSRCLVGELMTCGQRLIMFGQWPPSNRLYTLLFWRFVWKKSPLFCYNSSINPFNFVFCLMKYGKTCRTPIFYVVTNEFIARWIMKFRFEK